MNETPRLLWRFTGTKYHPVYISEIGKMVLMIEGVDHFCDQGWEGFYWIPSVDGVPATKWGIGFQRTFDKSVSMVWCERQAMFLLASSMSILCKQETKTP